MKASLLVPILLASVCCPGAAQAAPASLRVGEGILGQAWVFRWGNRCLAATARHLVVDEGDQPVSGGEISGPGGSIGYFGAPRIHPDSKLDIAVVEVEGPLARACPGTELGYDDTRPSLGVTGERRSVVMQGATAAGSPFSTPAEVELVVADEPFFFIREARQDRPFGGPGDSGSVIREQRTSGAGDAVPIGMAIRIDTDGRRRIKAVQFDQIKAFVKASFPNERRPVTQSSTGRLAVDLIGSTGASINASCNALVLLASQECTWVAAGTVSSPVSLTVSIGSVARPFRSVEFEFDPEGVPKGVAVAVQSPGSDRWTTMRYCPTNGATAISCRLGAVEASTVRVTFGQSVKLKRLFVRAD